MKNIEDMKKTQMEILDVKNTITKIKKKNSVDGLNNRTQVTEERISEMEQRRIDIAQSE